MTKQTLIPRILLLTSLLAGSVLIGCGTGDDRTVTERLREQVNPRVGAFLVEGQRAYERGAYRLALAYSDSAEALAPNLADVDYLRGLVYTELNQLHIAEAAFDRVLELDPAYQGARYSLGLNAFRRGKLRDAIDLYHDELAQGTSSGLYLELGRAYAKLGEPDSAQSAYEQAIALDSTNATAYMWLGQLYEELGELDEALVASRKGLALKPDDTDYRYIIGALLNRTGDAAEAVTYLRPVADERPWHHGAQYNLGQSLMRLGQEDEAQHYFVRADSAQQMQQRINEAQGDINRDPENLDTWIRLGDLLRQSGQLDRAIEAYKVAATLEPRNLYLQSNLALLMMEHGDLDDAIGRYRAIVSLDSTLTDVWLNLGVAYANAGYHDHARDAWETALRQRPDLAVARAYLEQLDAM